MKPLRHVTRPIARLMFAIDGLVLRCRCYWWCNTAERLWGTFDREGRVRRGNPRRNPTALL